MTKYHYTECGLDNVYITGLSPVKDDEGDEVITIKSINLLHLKIAEGIITTSPRLSGKELRFLRTELGVTQKDLAMILKKERQAIGRWERGEVEIDGPSDLLVRKIALEKCIKAYKCTIEELSKLIDEVKDHHRDINITSKGSNYDLAA